MDLTELSRRLENLIRIGTIAAVNHAAAKCRVKTGGITTGWMPWFAHRAGTTRDWDPPTIGEQVMVFSPSGELAGGIALIGIYSSGNTSPSSDADEHVVDYPDGARISYNHATGALVATGIQTAIVQSALSITLDTPYTHVTGTLEIDGLLTYHDGISGEGGGNGNVVNGSFIQSGGVLSSNDIVLHTHTHPGTGGPQ